MALYNLFIIIIIVCGADATLSRFEVCFLFQEIFGIGN